MTFGSPNKATIESNEPKTDLKKPTSEISKLAETVNQLTLKLSEIESKFTEKLSVMQSNYQDLQELTQSSKAAN